MLRFWRREKSCASCELYGTQVLCLEKLNHDLELRAVRAETKLELVERAFWKHTEPTPTGGGFVPLPEPDEPQPPAEVENFSNRLNEVFGAGLSLEEFSRREKERERAQRQVLEVERALVLRELNIIK